MIIVISGTPGAGKSTVSKALAEKFKKSAYISVDEIRHMIIGGNVAPWDDTNGEQYKLIEKNFLDLANNFLNEGFVVIIDDVIGDEQVKRYKEQFDEVYGFLLLPSKETLKKRDLLRDPEYQMAERIDVLYPEFANVEHDVLKVIDSTDQTEEETVEEIYNILDKPNKL
jgi:broad-specificity NMP kinase